MADAAEKNWKPGADLAVQRLTVAAAGAVAVAAGLLDSPRGSWNLLCVAGLLCLLALWMAPCREVLRTRIRPAWVLMAVVVWWMAMPPGFVSDDFVLLDHSRNSTFRTLMAAFARAGGDGFYRPVGYLWLGLNSWWAGDQAWRWGLIAAAVHAGNAGLVFVLARRLPGIEPWQAAAAALLFGLHGALVESVGWLAGTFDLISTSFVLLALCCLERAPWAALLFMALAQGTKEPAFAFPLLAGVWLAALGRWRTTRVLAAILVTGGIFAWRAWLLGGIGGYAPAGVSQFWEFGWLGYVKALGWRLWGALFFPLKAGAGSKVLLILLAAGLVVLALQARRHASARWGFALLLASALVPAHLMLFGPDLLKSRVLYLPLFGFSVALAAAARRPAALALYIAAQMAVLRANYGQWQSVAGLAGEACAAAVRCEAGTSMPRLPATLDGVYFFSNGFPECVARAAGKPFTPSARWNEPARKIECLSRGASPGLPGSSGVPPAAKD